MPVSATIDRFPSLRVRYDAWVKEGRVQDDPAQRQVLGMLEALQGELDAGALGKLFKKSPKGLYIWGHVGRGKSMLMDLFFDTAPAEKKRRAHFHAFMQEVHERIHKIRQGGSGADPVMLLAQQISAETSLLCFDELQATDVADATLLYRLFSGLFEAGVVVVSTSNHPPASLYTGGVQRERFDKFIALIEAHMDVAALSSEQDYRQVQDRAEEKRYVWPLGEAADAFVASVVSRLCKNPHPQSGAINVHGRKVHFSLYDDAIGRFSFHELCENALGAADYLAIAKRLKILILTDIPRLKPEKRNEAKRFVTLVDALYEHKVALFATAECPSEEIYREGDGAFEFTRTVSRLVEMQSKHWGGR